MRARRISIGNQKGGAMKTATAVNLAAALGERGYRVLLVDCDAQANATSYLGLRGLSVGDGLLDVLHGKKLLSEVAVETKVENVWLVPATDLLNPAHVQEFLAKKVGRDLLLKKTMDRDPDLDVEFVFFDTAPALSLLNVLVWVACDELVVPFEPHPHHVDGFLQLFEKVKEIQDAFDGLRIHIEGLVPCRVDRSLIQRDLLDQVREQHPRLLYETAIRQNIRVAESPSHALPVTRYAPKSAGATDYRELAGEFLRRRGQPERLETAEMPANPQSPEMPQIMEKAEIPQATDDGARARRRTAKGAAAAAETE